MNKKAETKSGASAIKQSSINIRTNVFFDIKERNYKVHNQYISKTYRERGVVERILGQNVIIDDRRGGKHNRNVLEVKRV